MSQTTAREQALATIPAVDAVLRTTEGRRLVTQYGHNMVAETTRRIVTERRDELRASSDVGDRSSADVTDAVGVAARVRQALAAEGRRRVRRVINATGVVLHTNLGRAPLSDAAKRAVLEACGYASVELDLDTGTRGSRTAYVGELAARLCGTPDATVVNNGAAAVLLVLTALGAGRQVVVSRGELVEIGGSFRLPDIMATAGVHLVEVGTTNRTRVEDYRAAIGPDTGLLLKVHRSNFRQVGFTAEAPVAELAALARSVGVPLVHDLGSGLVAPGRTGASAVSATSLAGLAAKAGEPDIAVSVAAGCDVLIFSGDKLLGGPQAGIIAGGAPLVAACRQHPLFRAVRIDKLQRAALEATLLTHLAGTADRDLPVLATLAEAPDGVRARAVELCEQLKCELPAEVAVGIAPTVAMVGGGTLPGVERPSTALVLTGPPAAALASRLRQGRPPVIARVQAGRVLLDLTTVGVEEHGLLVDAVRAAVR